MAKQVELNKQKGKSTGLRENRPVWNNVQRLNHQNKFVPTAVLTKTGKFLVNTARQKFTSQAASTRTARKVNTARTIGNEIRPIYDVQALPRRKLYCQNDKSIKCDGNDKVIMWYQEPRFGLEFCLVDLESVNLINIFNLLSEDCLKDLVSNKQSGNPTFSLHKEITSPEVIPKFHDSKGCTFLSEELPDIDSFNDIHPHFDDDPLSGSTTYSANSLLEEFADELALISYPPDYDDNHACDIESDIREIEFLLFQGEDSDFKGKCGEAGKSLKQLQWVEREKQNKM
nr:hypothetical protein [Tanacetum cinerariifolium]